MFEIGTVYAVCLLDWPFALYQSALHIDVFRPRALSSWITMSFTIRLPVNSISSSVLLVFQSFLDANGFVLVRFVSLVVSVVLSHLERIFESGCVGECWS